MRVLVCGGRDFIDQSLVDRTLDALDESDGPITAIIEGGQRTWDQVERRVVGGADYWAEQWAFAHPEVEHRRVNAEWSKLGPAAGPIRNGRMLTEEKPDLVIGFPGGKGTADMVRRARAAGVEVRSIVG